LSNDIHCTDEETIDLRELFAIIKKRKKLITVLTGIVTFLAVVYAFFLAKPVYETKAMLEIGKIDTKPIDDIENVKQKLMYEYQVNVSGKMVPLPRVASINIPKGTRTILGLTIHAHSNQEGKAFIQTVIRKIEHEYQTKTDSYIEGQKELIRLTQEEIDDNTKSLAALQKELHDYSERIISLKAEDAALAGIFALQIGQKQSQVQKLKQYISGLKEKQQRLELSISPLKLTPTHVVGKIDMLNKPVKPKKKLIVIVAFITGLMLALFLAFVLEFFEGEKRREESEEGADARA